MTANLMRLVLLSLLWPAAGGAAIAADGPAAGDGRFDGRWVANLELSDDTDRAVEDAFRRAGHRPPDTGRQGRERYRGGPEDQALYDHVSYDLNLEFDQSGAEFRLVYDDGYERVFYSDNRKRVVSASGTSSGDDRDFSFASWDGRRLLVESTVRDGGWIHEVFELDPGGDRLTVRLELKPVSFAEPIRLTRIYDRAGSRQP